MSLAQAIVLSPDDNVAVANGRIESGTELPGGAEATSADRSRPQGGDHPITAGEAVVKYAQAIGRATEDIAPGDAHPFAQSGLRIRPPAGRAADRRRSRPATSRQGPHLHGLSPRRRPRRHPQLHRHHRQRELLDHRLPRHRRRGQPRTAAAISRHRRLRADRPRPGLRHERHRRRHEDPAPHAGRLCAPSEFRRRR